MAIIVELDHCIGQKAEWIQYVGPTVVGQIAGSAYGHLDICLTFTDTLNWWCDNAKVLRKHLE